ncbi:MAG: universal stress protein [Catenulispora sp.]
MTAPVVVGIDDIHNGAHALALAAREAELRGSQLWIAHAYHRLPASTAGEKTTVSVRDPEVEPLAQAVKQARAEHPGLEVHGYAVGGPPALGLTGLARDAALLVLGHRGRGGFAGMLLGSVALRTAARASGPVAVACGAERAVDRVLVGLDIADPSDGAALLGYAFAEAALRRAELVAVHVWQDSGSFYPDPVGDYTPDRLAELDGDHRRTLEAVLAPWRGRHPEVVVDTLVEGGSAARGLVAASGHADLLVIGARRHADGAGLRLGVLAYSLLHHAKCPVVVVPDAAGR